MSDSIEVPLLRVPFEALKRTSRDRKYVIDQLQTIATSMKDIASRPCSEKERLEALNSAIAMAKELQNTLDAMNKAETEDAERCLVRLQHLKELGTPSKDEVLDWNRKRLPRILVDHLLRSNCYTTATELIKLAHLEGLVDQHIFDEAQPIVTSLQRHDCGPALVWCAANKAKLKKTKSKFEFELRLQECIELGRKGEKIKAIKHAQQHLAPWAGLFFCGFQRGVTALVFGADTSCEPYKTLYGAQQWQELITIFYLELFRLHNMTQESLLALQLQAGLSALKSPPGSCPHDSKEDPLHQESFKSLAEGLPFAKHVHSRLVCSITKEIMNEHNPPMVLPNGTVYSEAAVDAHTTNGQFVDPITGAAFPRTELRRAFIS